MKKFSILIILLLCSVIVVLAGTVMKLSRSSEEQQSSQGIVFEPIQDPSQDVQAGSSLPGIVIPGWTAIKLPAGSESADVSLHNPEGNSGYYDLEFTLKLSETGEVIFSTGKIAPGFKCSKVELEKKLEPGRYEAIMMVQPYLQDEAQTPTNNAEMEITIIVE